MRDAVNEAFEATLAEPAPVEDPRARVLDLLRSTVNMLTHTPIGPLFRSMIPHLPRHPELGRLANQLGLRRRARLHEAMTDARAAGALPDLRNLDSVLDGLLGAIYFRYLITQRPIDDRYLGKLLDDLTRARPGLTPIRKGRLPPR